jgi:hypothetical protein
MVRVKVARCSITEWDVGGSSSTALLNCAMGLPLWSVGGGGGCHDFFYTLPWDRRRTTTIVCMYVWREMRLCLVSSETEQIAEWMIRAISSTSVCKCVLPVHRWGVVLIGLAILRYLTGGAWTNENGELCQVADGHIVVVVFFDDPTFYDIDIRMEWPKNEVIPAVVVLSIRHMLPTLSSPTRVGPVVYVYLISHVSLSLLCLCCWMTIVTLFHIRLLIIIVGVLSVCGRRSLLVNCRLLTSQLVL